MPNHTCQENLEEVPMIFSLCFRANLTESVCTVWFGFGTRVDQH
jgi:hypothetical protein